jgi:serine/threonine-protein kinase
MRAPPNNTLDIRHRMKRCSSCQQHFSGEAAFCPFDGTKLEHTAPEPLADPLLGTTVDGRYEVEQLLGQGGMGHVYEVRHVVLDRRFAMKVLRRDLARDDEVASRFLREAKATATVRHPNVVAITDFGRLADGAPYFVMELLVGETLGRVIKTGGPIPARRAVKIIQQIAGALAAAHAAGVVHRDLKPDNVFLVGGASEAVRDDVRVVDFGAAKMIGSSRVTRQGIVFGTPHYMSPEQASGQPVDHRADIYALGIILYEMFTGRVPFEADTYMGVLTQHMFVQPVPPSRACAAARELGALEEITMICLAKKPEHRFDSMEELRACLREIVDVKSDGRVRIASRLEPRAGKSPRRRWGPHSSSAQDPPSVRYRMADELEPPTLEEMRLAIDSVLPPRRVVPYTWLGAAAAVILAATAGWAIVERAGVREKVPAAAATANPPATTSEAVPPAPAEPVRAASAASSAVSGTGAATPPPTGVALPPATNAPTAAAATPANPSARSSWGPVASPSSVRAQPPKKPAWTATDDIADPFENRR